jgi:fructokinase
MLTSIYHNKISGARLHLIGEEEWSQIITSAIDFATHVCMSYENYISDEFAKGLKIEDRPDTIL